jgi:hypothetical protein
VTTPSGNNFANGLTFKSGYRYDLFIHSGFEQGLYGGLQETLPPGSFAATFPNTTENFRLTYQNLFPFPIDVQVGPFTVYKGSFGRCGVKKKP